MVERLRRFELVSPDHPVSVGQFIIIMFMILMGHPFKRVPGPDVFFAAHQKQIHGVSQRAPYINIVKIVIVSDVGK
jgi:hypothetical protein